MDGNVRDYGPNGGLVAAFSKREMEALVYWNDWPGFEKWTPYDPMFHSLRKPEQQWMQFNNSGFIEVFGRGR